MKSKAITLALSLLFGVSSVALAQGYDDDDIYFDPSKAPKPKKEVKKTVYEQPNAMIYYPAEYYQAADYPAADTYILDGNGRSISVDDYNRRGIFGSDTTHTVTDSILASQFANTRRIERFYNPEVVKGSGDSELAQVYYAQPANVNIIINDPYPYGAGYWGWGPSWAYGPYSWRWGAWNSWYSWNWGPSWAWGPSWSWSWGPGWDWGWGPGWGPSWGWGPGWGSSWGWASTRPHRPGSVGNIRPGTGYRPGRPASGTYRPSGTGTGTRPGSSSGYRQGRGNVRGTNNRGYNYNNNSNNNYNNNSNNGYRPGSSYNNGSSWGGGSSGGGFRGGSGGSRGGGGTGRGRH